MKGVLTTTHHSRTHDLTEPPLSDRTSLLDTILEILVPVHRDGMKFVGIGVVATLILFLLWAPLGWIAAVLTALRGLFLPRSRPRDAAARRPRHRPGRRAHFEHRAASCRRPSWASAMPSACAISIFLSVFDVHINRAPVAGRITRSLYVPGAFLNAALDKASEENERRALIIETASGTEIAVVQIAGLIARRIVTFSREGDSVGTGQRFGLIRFGSRVDTYLPPGRTALVAVGQLAVAGETVLADLKSAEAEREARRH